MTGGKTAPRSRDELGLFGKRRAVGRAISPDGQTGEGENVEKYSDGCEYKSERLRRQARCTNSRASQSIDGCVSTVNKSSRETARVSICAVYRAGSKLLLGQVILSGISVIRAACDNNAVFFACSPTMIRAEGRTGSANNFAFRRARGDTPVCPLFDCIARALNIR